MSAITAKKRLTFISVHDPGDIGTWSGINYFLLKALQQHFEVDVITGLQFKHTLSLKIGYRLSTKLGYHFLYELTPSVAKQLGKFLSQRIHHESQLVFTVNSHVLPYLQTTKPIYLLKDSTLELLNGYYDFASNLHPVYQYIAHRLEKKAFQQCRHIFMSSQWAADSVMQDYGVPAHKVSVWPFGANLSQVPDTVAVLQSIQLRTPHKIRLLWVGVDRKRKGADTAITVAKQLQQRGLNVWLDIVGINPEDGEELPPFIQFWGKLNKAIAGEQIQLAGLFQNAHFFILPTHIDCSPVVISEAAAFGLPVLATPIAGIPTLVKHETTGFLVRDVEDYLSSIDYCVNNWHAYQCMSKAARLLYNAELSWAFNTEKFIECFTKKD